jgi:outer membrane protein OmpA-like peptidoglycan-associated protein
VTDLSGSGGSLVINNVCSDYGILYTYGPSTSGSIPGTSFDNGIRSSTTAMLNGSGTLTIFRCAIDAQNAGSVGGCSTSNATQVTQVTSSIPPQNPTYSGPVGTPSSATVTTTGLVVGQTNPNPITVKMTVATGNNSETVIINMPTGWTWVTPVAFQTPCASPLPIDSYTGFTYNFCRASNGNTILSQLTTASELYLRNLVGTKLAAGTEVTVVIKAGALNVGAGTDFVIGFGLGASVVDKATVSVGATPAQVSTTTAAAPVKGTAAALAALPKSSTQPKLKFVASDNGLSSASKKSLKKVADVAKDGYGVRVTGAAGMQAGVPESAVKALAKKRALEIRDYLIKQGVPKEDIIIKTKIFPIGKAPATLVKVETLS